MGAAFLCRNQNGDGAKQIDEAGQPQAVKDRWLLTERSQTIDGLIFCRAEEPAETLIPVFPLVFEKAEPVARQLIIQAKIQN